MCLARRKRLKAFARHTGSHERRCNTFIPSGPADVQRNLLRENNNGTAIETKAKLFITITSSTSRVYCSLLLKTTNSITVGSKTFANVARDADRPKVHRAFIRQRTQRRLILVKIAPSAPSVCLSTVSRPVELSLQSSFQLSLAVLVRYRSLLGEIYHPLWAAVSSNPTRLGAATPCTKH
ncbi:conserved hypothetical protein, partial [Trichinella spiralis]|uniref:hypothetical protein n=1 Tax=Trichinella spiralis TaxID=6334 RepID=UPI0001EFB544